MVIMYTIIWRVQESKMHQPELFNDFCTKTLETKFSVQVNEEFISSSSIWFPLEMHKEIQVDNVVIVQDVNNSETLLKDISISSTKSNLWIISLNCFEKVHVRIMWSRYWGLWFLHYYKPSVKPIEDYGFSIIIKPRSSLFKGEANDAEHINQDYLILIYVIIWE